ncbi:PcfB family protein [Clostridium sp. AF18-27]|uniref:PcfB family protein n=4 Tax=Lachnospiraceae TaxID=186803 RepID=A0A3E3I131_9FIRM|nr:PcfB family protein [Hungatella hathewayi]RGE58112.1 PcfB family protein [Eisenbergiella massiliensis]RGV68088.1 PcfB family protein [Enterocloster bolteae]RGX28968.1 PcfB family protein [Enterocloster asparagiformis]RHB64060.1 PcfB family protein [[Clostridium] symbiosum]RHR50071.1 PcfB family protein [Clostridium sp. AF18-27]
MAVSIKASKLTARGLAYVLQAVGRKITKAHRAKQAPHGRQTVGQLMGQGVATNSIEVEAPKLFDRVARKWNVDYAFYKVAPDKHLLFFKSGQADAITACFSEYSKRLLKRTKSTKAPIREQLKEAADLLARQPSHKKERAREAAHEDR